jgi:predicted alpha/beta-fold hydrolase
MPLIESSFSPPRVLRSAWLQTITPAVARRITLPPCTVETIALADGDLLELAWHPPLAPRRSISAPPRGLVVVTHGLEGSRQSTYVLGLARLLCRAGYLVLAWNMRGCGRKPNKLATWYHSGKSDDLMAVIMHARRRYPELRLSAVGFSIGGNILCKLLGEQGSRGTHGITAAVAVSAPLDLRGAAEALAHPSRRLYMEYFLRPLRARIREKAARFPELFSTARLDAITTFYEFDSLYTAPMHGFRSAEQYWEICSGRRYLEAITTPLLILTAKDDPFLSPLCFPQEIAMNSASTSLEAPEHGGHVGFIDSVTMRTTWCERRALEFLECAHNAASGCAACGSVAR